MLPILMSMAFAQTAPVEPASAAAEVEETFEDEEIADEIFIWADKYARWRNTRWHIVSELVLPTGFQLLSRKNKDFDTIAIQLRSVFSCNPEYERKRMQVGCTIEDIGIQSTSTRRFKKEKDRAIVQAILDEIDQDLTGAVVQMQTNERGAITNLDIEGLPVRLQREKLRAEILRQLVGRLAYPFHVKLPKTVQGGTNWPEFDSALMRMPAEQASQGSSVIVHYINAYEGHLLVQDIGEGQVLLEPLPRRETDSLAEAAPGESLAGPTDAGGSDGGLQSGGTNTPSADTSANSLAGSNPSGFRSIGSPVQFKMRLDGVSIFDPKTGVMQERVWALKGRGNAQLNNQMSLWYTGRIRLLGKTEKVDVGPTQQISYPWFQIEGLPRWLPVDPDLASQIEDLTQK